jgi:hypothetical protein
LPVVLQNVACELEGCVNASNQNCLKLTDIGFYAKKFGGLP